MRNIIAQIDYQNLLGVPPGKRLFRVNSGEFAGRILAIFRESNHDIAFSFSDAPFTDWSTPETIASDSSSFPFDAAMAEDGTVWIAYVENTTEYLAVRKLSFSDGVWTAGEKAYAFYGNTFGPSIAVEPSGKLWLGFGRLNAGFFDMQVKSSADDGATWGSGSSDFGDTLRQSLYVPICRLLLSPNKLTAVYNGTLTDIYARWMPLSGGDWSDEQLIATGSDLNEQFDAAVSEDGLLGVVFNSDRLYYREFDGSNWGAQTVLDESRGGSPQIYFSRKFPVVVYLGTTEGEETALKFVHRSTGAFSSPQALEPRADLFDRVLLYDSGTGRYSDCTSTAASATDADFFHEDSGALLSSQRDALFVGLSRKFRYLQFHLSTPGEGGSVSYSYWDGLAWKSFTPHGSSYNLSTATEQLALWADLSSIPVDWQKCAIEDNTLFWVRIETVTNFTTPPIGSRLTSRSHIESLVARR
jgi:hypothetical protein